MAGTSRVVLLGEATHGTHEFYHWRAKISKRLIQEHGFSFIAVEGDWPDCYRVNRFVKGYDDAGDDARTVLRSFDRWPTWMWANEEVAELVEWMRAENDNRVEGNRVGFYGMDVYSLWDSMREVVAYLERVDPAAARHARRAYACFDRFDGDEQAYARSTLFVPSTCEDEVVSMLDELRSRRTRVRDSDGADSHFDAEQNALVASNAERYYREMVRGGAASWNVRDRHMMETLDRLLRHHGSDSRAIVWEHNTHIGDARYTDMRRAGMVNVGQLARETYGEHFSNRNGALLVGFGTHHGTVIAGDEWGAPQRTMMIPPARTDSFEAMLHDAGGGRDLLVTFDGSDDGGIRGLDAVIPHRAIGVVYDPTMERFGNWVPTVVPRRYDAFLFFEESRALSPLHLERGEMHEMETFPSGV
jgi:erythromycin esterase-like protein